MTNDAEWIERKFGERVRELRNAEGMSQSALAEQLAFVGGPRLTHSTIAKIERGARGVGLGEAVLLSQVLGIPLTDMLAGEVPDAAIAIAEAQRDALAAERALRGAQEHLRSLGVTLMGGRGMNAAEEASAARQADRFAEAGLDPNGRPLPDSGKDGD